jgi:hypothetical protein
VPPKQSPAPVGSSSSTPRGRVDAARPVECGAAGRAALEHDALEQRMRGEQPGDRALGRLRPAEERQIGVARQEQMAGGEHRVERRAQRRKLSISGRTFGSNDTFAPARAASITPRCTAAIAASLVSDEPITWK